MLKNKKKNQNGITLVALVVTIIVLIILATISINIIFSDDGIMERAKESIAKWANAEEVEKAILAETSNSIDGYIAGERDNENDNSNTQTGIETVLLEEVWVQSQVPTMANGWVTVKELSLAGYGSGKAIISYSATNSENNANFIATQIMKNSTIHAFDETIVTTTEGKWSWLLSSASTTISYDENTIIQFQISSDQIYNPGYMYSILLIKEK